MLTICQNSLVVEVAHIFVITSVSALSENKLIFIAFCEKEKSFSCDVRRKEDPFSYSGDGVNIEVTSSKFLIIKNTIN